MEPGQVAVQAALWLGALPGGVESQAILGVEIPVSHRVAGVAWIGAQRHADGGTDPRDATVAVQWLPVSRPEITVRLQPGLSVPTGGIGGGLTFTPLSTASLDPWLSADAVVGTQWMGAAAVVARVPLYEGWDHVRQGPFVRGDLRLARRLAKGVLFAGVSAVRQAPSRPVAAPAFGELAATAGGVVNLGPRWSVTAQVRVPGWVSTGAERVFSGGVGVRAVVGSPPEGHEH